MIFFWSIFRAWKIKDLIGLLKRIRDHASKSEGNLGKGFEVSL